MRLCEKNYVNANYEEMTPVSQEYDGHSWLVYKMGAQKGMRLCEKNYISANYEEMPPPVLREYVRR